MIHPSIDSKLGLAQNRWQSISVACYLLGAKSTDKNKYWSDLSPYLCPTRLRTMPTPAVFLLRYNICFCCGVAYFLWNSILCLIHCIYPLSSRQHLPNANGVILHDIINRGSTKNTTKNELVYISQGIIYIISYHVCANPCSRITPPHSHDFFYKPQRYGLGRITSPPIHLQFQWGSCINFSFITLYLINSSHITSEKNTGLLK